MILAVDTSTQQIGVCLYEGHAVMGELSWHSGRHHTVELAPSINMLMSRCGVAIDSLKGLAVAIGPGSFTSLRVGLSHIKGMALALHIPVFGVPTLDIVAGAQPASELPLVAVLHAGRTRLAYQVYHYHSKGWRSESDPVIAYAHDLAEQVQKEAIICGELSAEDVTELKKIEWFHLGTPANNIRRPAILAEIAWKRLMRKNFDDPATLAPIYLHIANPLPG
jgi:tRNA threonylcarbamoyladenosine biosynthesis protein TsaB